MNFQDFLASFKPGFDPVPINEKIRSGVAAFMGMLLLGFALHLLPGTAGYHLAVLASMAAAAVLLYAVPHSPMTQPWSLVCGNLVSGLIGWICSLWIPDPMLAAACAVGAAVLAMHLLNCLHPPGGATAMIMVLGAEQFHQHGWEWVAATVIANTLLSLLLALVINNLLPGRRYPSHRTIVQPTSQGGELDTIDIKWALSRMDGVIDVSEQDLLEIYRLASGRVRMRTP